MVHGERCQRGPILCSTERGRCYFQQGSSSYVAYVMDTQDKGKATVDDVPIVRDYPYVFLEDFPRVPPKRQVDFRIDIVPSAAPIPKAPYQLDPPKMQELST